MRFGIAIGMGTIHPEGSTFSPPAAYRLWSSAAAGLAAGRPNSPDRLEHFDDLAVLVSVAKLLKVHQDVCLGLGGYEVEGTIV
jgi:hypothetical protein